MPFLCPQCAFKFVYYPGSASQPDDFEVKSDPYIWFRFGTSYRDLAFRLLMDLRRICYWLSTLRADARILFHHSTIPALHEVQLDLFDFLEIGS